MTYYLFVPNSQLPTAEVEADTKDHARTAFLDYLSHNNIIPYSDRGSMRRKIKGVRSSPGEIEASVSLNYGQAPPSEYEPVEPTEPVFQEETPTGPPAEPPIGPPTEIDSIEGEEPEPEERELEPVGAGRSRNMFGGSPIAALSRDTLGKIALRR